MNRGGMIVIALAVVVGAIAAGALIAIASPGGEDSKRSGQELPGAPEAEDQSTHGLDVADRSVRRFLEGYLPLVYGQRGATPNAIQSAKPELIDELRANPARVPPAQEGLSARVEGVTLAEDARGEATATARIRAGSSPAYALTLHVSDTPNGWLVTRISP